MKFRYTGEFPDGAAIVQYEVVFTPDGVSEVADETAIKKLLGNRFFEVVEGDAAPAAADTVKPRGRPRKAAVEADDNTNQI